MSKKNFVSLLLGTVGGILFALGACMTMVPQWNALQPGVVTGCIGLAVLLVMLVVRRKMAGKPIFIKVSGKTIFTVLVALVGALLLGLGMCLITVWNVMVYGIIVGIIGIVLLICLIPLIKGVED